VPGPLRPPLPTARQQLGLLLLLTIVLVAALY
jgi:hypothetical protein